MLDPKYHDQKHIDQSPFSQWCPKNKKIEIKENIIHALWDCQKINNFPEKEVNELDISHLVQLPLLHWRNW